jgi:16S rRNA (guanine527-N7)-methyltransferase
MDTACLIRRGLDHFGIPAGDATVAHLVVYVTELQRWGGKVNLTGVKGTDEIVKELLFDGFFLCNHLREDRLIVDMGSGGGVVGIPLAILNGMRQVISVDSSLRKIQFQRHLKRLLQLQGFYPVHGRIETLDPLGADSLVAKAFGTIDDILEKGVRHVKKGGRILTPRGRQEEAHFRDGYGLPEVVPYTLPLSGKSCTLVIYQKG